MEYNNILNELLSNKENYDKQTIEECSKKFIRMYNTDVFREDIEIFVLGLLLSYVIESNEFYNKNINDLLFVTKDLLFESNNYNELIYRRKHFPEDSIARGYLEDFLLGPTKATDKAVQNVIEYLEQENRKIENLLKLEVIGMLVDNWNGNGANSFNETLTNKVKELLLNLKIQPEIFPTAADSIQLEYDFDDGFYIEFEVSDNDKIDVFMIDNDITENFYRINCNHESIWRELQIFLEK